MPATITTQTATYTRNRHDYTIDGYTYVGYDSAPLAAKRFAQALASLGWTISVVTDTTAEYDETASPGDQPNQLYAAHVYDPEYNVGIYINCRSDYSSSYKSPSYYGWYAYFRTGWVNNGAVNSVADTEAYCFDATPLTITKQSSGSFVRYIFPLGATEVKTSNSIGSCSYSNSRTFRGNFVTLSIFSASNMFTGEASLFGSFGVRDSNSWIVNKIYNIASRAQHNYTGHSSAGPQPSSDKAVLWQTPINCNGKLYDKIEGGRLFCTGRGDNSTGNTGGSLPAGADFTLGGVTLRALSSEWALELIT